MKKLIIGAAVAFAATFANAAAVNWLAEGVPMENAVVLVYSAENSGKTLNQMITALTTEGVSALTTPYDFGVVADGTDAYSADPTGTYGKGETFNYYALVLNVDDMADIGNAKQFAYYNNKEITVPENDPRSIDVSFSGPSAFQDIKTSAVPEPTSGLLLLLGMAGLALRRRRA